MFRYQPVTEAKWILTGSVTGRGTAKEKISKGTMEINREIPLDGSNATTFSLVKAAWTTATCHTSPYHNHEIGWSNSTSPRCALSFIPAPLNIYRN